MSPDKITLFITDHQYDIQQGADIEVVLWGRKNTRGGILRAKMVDKNGELVEYFDSWKKVAKPRNKLGEFPNILYHQNIISSYNLWICGSMQSMPLFTALI